MFIILILTINFHKKLRSWFILLHTKPCLFWLAYISLHWHSIHIFLFQNIAVIDWQKRATLD